MHGTSTGAGFFRLHGLSGIGGMPFSFAPMGAGLNAGAPLGIDVGSILQNPLSGVIFSSIFSGMTIGKMIPVKISIEGLFGYLTEKLGRSPLEILMERVNSGAFGEMSDSQRENFAKISKAVSEKFLAANFNLETYVQSAAKDGTMLTGESVLQFLQGAETLVVSFMESAESNGLPQPTQMEFLQAKRAFGQAKTFLTSLGITEKELCAMDNVRGICSAAQTALELSAGVKVDLTKEPKICTIMTPSLDGISAAFAERAKLGYSLMADALEKQAKLVSEGSTRKVWQFFHFVYDMGFDELVPSMLSFVSQGKKALSDEQFLAWISAFAEQYTKTRGESVLPAKEEFLKMLQIGFAINADEWHKVDEKFRPFMSIKALVKWFELQIPTLQLFDVPKEEEKQAPVQARGAGSGSSSASNQVVNLD